MDTIRRILDKVLKDTTNKLFLDNKGVRLIYTFLPSYEKQYCIKVLIVRGLTIGTVTISFDKMNELCNKLRGIDKIVDAII